MARSFQIGRVWMLCILIPLAACTAIEAYPSRTIPASEELNADILFVPEAVLKDYYAAGDDARPLIRDRFITMRMAAIDKQYAAFLKKLQAESSLASLGVDLAVLGLGTAGALLPAGSVTRILAGTSAALTGARASYDKNVLLDQTVLALVAQMEASRATVRAEILKRASLKEDNFTYTMLFVQADIQRYYYAGTIPGALLTINETIGVEARTADRNLNNVQNVNITPVVLELERLLTNNNPVATSYAPLRVVQLGECAKEQKVTEIAGVTDPQSRALADFLLLGNENQRLALAACLQAKINAKGE